MPSGSNDSTFTNVEQITNAIWVLENNLVVGSGCVFKLLSVKKCGGSRSRSPSFSMVRLVVSLNSVASCDFNSFWMHAFPRNPSVYTRNTVIDRKSVIQLTSVLVFKPGLMPHQLINQ
jgi:hypothetical protein